MTLRLLSWLTVGLWLATSGPALAAGKEPSGKPSASVGASAAVAPPPPPKAAPPAPKVAPPPPKAAAAPSKAAPPPPKAATVKASSEPAVAAPASDSGGKAAAPPAAGAAASVPNAGAPASTPPAGSGSAATDYTVRLRDLESRVDELKEQIRRSHTRLSLLSDTILSGGLGGAHAELAFRNELGNAFRITSLLFVLDGTVQYKKEDESGELSKQKTIPIFSGPIPPGDHTVQVVVGMRGHGYGVFSYLKAYKPKAKRTHSFTVDEGRSARVEVVLWEKGGATTPVEQRPALRFVQRVRDRSEALNDEVE